MRYVAWFAILFGCVFGRSVVGQDDLASQMDKAIALLRTQPDPDQSAIQAMLAAAGQGYFQRKDYSTALARVAESIEICQREKNYGELELPLQLAIRILDKSDDNAPKSFLIRLLKNSGKDIPFKKKILSVLGKYLVYGGDLVFAITVHRERLLIVREENPGSVEEIETLMDFAQACLLGKIYDLAAQALNEGEELAIKLKRDDLIAQFQFQRGTALFNMGNYPGAQKLFNNQVSYVRKTKEKIGLGQAFQSLIDTTICLNDLPLAKKMANVALKELKEPLEKGTMTMRLAVIAMLNPDEKDDQKFSTAIRLAKKALAEKQTSPSAAFKSVSGLATLQDNLFLASLHLASNQLDKAKIYVDAAARGFGSLQASFDTAAKLGALPKDQANVALTYTQAAISDLAQQIFVREKKYGEALVVAESGRAYAHARLMEKRLGIKPDPKVSKPLTLDDFQTIAKRQNKTIVYYSIVHYFDANVRNILPSNHPARRPHALLIWVANPKGNISFRSVPLRGDLTNLVKLAREEIRPPRPKPQPKPKAAPKKAADVKNPKSSESGSKKTVPNDNEKPRATYEGKPQKKSLSKTKSGDGGQKTIEKPQESDPKKQGKLQGGQKAAPKITAMQILHSLLIQPIEDRLPGDLESKVAFVPDGVLFNVPFAALANPKGTPLIARHTLSVVPSVEILALAELQHAKNQKSKNQEILLVGNPTMPFYQSRPDRPAKQLSALKGAEKEVTILGEMLKVTPLIGDQATEKVVVGKMKQARVIHLATHGGLEKENVFAQAYLSSVALAPGDSDDGFLTVGETMRLDLAADLVVLSACDTGLGRITGDGVIGLTRGYISAGVPTVVASLWPVSDNSAGYLMVVYYSAMQRGIDKATALRIAMLETRKKFPLPRDWAAFSIYGLAE